MEQNEEKKAKHATDENELRKNSLQRVILTAITCLEWQAEYLRPIKFESIKISNSVIKAIKRQLREFDGLNVRPCTYLRNHER